MISTVYVRIDFNLRQLRKKFSRKNRKKVFIRRGKETADS